ncbi:MAG TPA: F0F1 ATP synthase subunit A [Chloroflexi bacterium]|nr:F0F1 ATP synthase subunit A [Chloroflexota bacterium]
MKNKALIYAAGALVLLVLGVMFLRFELPVVSVSAETLWTVGGFKITNAYFTSVVVTLLIIIVAFVGTRDLKIKNPSGLQNVLEMIVEGLYNLTEGVSGPKWVARFFIVPTTIFIYVLMSNWFGLLPGLAGIGLCQEHHVEAAHAEEAHAEEASHGETAVSSTTCPQGQVIVPFFRSPSADLNNTLMLALVTQVMAQVFGFSALGGGYLKKFFVFGGVAAAFKPDEHGNKRSVGGMMMQLAMGVIDIFVGLLEFLSEFVKIVAFTFRLFGNIFAGEVMLIVLTFLVPVMLTLPFLGLEVFVGAVQAFVFFILSIAFYTVAVTSHDHDEAH